MCSLPAKLQIGRSLAGAGVVSLPDELSIDIYTTFFQGGGVACNSVKSADHVGWAGDKTDSPVSK